MVGLLATCGVAYAGARTLLVDDPMPLGLALVSLSLTGGFALVADLSVPARGGSWRARFA